MTAGQIETGNSYALEVFGKWHRRNIGRDEAEYQVAKANLEKQRKAKIEVERQAAAARAERQRNLIGQRDADAKLAIALERESKQAALEAAQEKAEEAKRLAFIEKRRKEEEARLAVLREEQQKQKKIDAARNRLEELKAKQKNNVAVAAPVVKAIPTAPVVAAPLKKENSPVIAKNTPKPVVQTKNSVAASPLPVVPAKKSKQVIDTKAIASPTTPKTNAQPLAKVSSDTSVANTEAKTKPEAIIAPAPEAKPVQKMEKTEAVKTVAPVVKTNTPVVKSVAPVVITTTPVVKSVEPVVKTTSVVAKTEVVAAKPATVSTVEKKPYKAQVAPSNATIVAAKPVEAGKMKLPVMTNGLDVAVVKEIVEKANSVPLNTGVAKQEISKGRTNISALKWSLISAARGKGSAKQMNILLEKSMTSVQIAEANRLAAKWINKRQKRQ